MIKTEEHTQKVREDIALYLRFLLNIYSLDDIVVNTGIAKKRLLSYIRCERNTPRTHRKLITDLYKGYMKKQEPLYEQNPPLRGHKLNTYVDKETKELFKLTCKRKEINMSLQLFKLVKDFIDREG